MAADEEELREDLRNIFSDKDAFAEQRKGKDPYVILVNGKRITLKNGKSMWPNKGAAKNSLRYHLDNLFWAFKNANGKKEYELKDRDGRESYYKIKQVIKEEQDAWIEKHVVFVPYSDYAIAASKIGKVIK